MKDDDQPTLPGIPTPPRPRGRPRIHPDRRAAQAAASRAYRARKRAEREALERLRQRGRQVPDIEDGGIIDLSAIPDYRIRKRP